MNQLVLHSSLWTTHRILDIGSVNENFYKNFKNYHQYCKSDNSQIHTVIVQDLQSRSIKVANANANASANETKHDPKEEWNQLSVEQTIKKTVTSANHQSYRKPRLTSTSSRHHLNPSSTQPPNSTKIFSCCSCLFTVTSKDRTHIH